MEEATSQIGYKSFLLLLDKTSIQIGVIGGALVFLFLSIVIIGLVLYLNKRFLIHQEELSRIQLNKQKELLDASFQVQEQERERIGRDIHDEIGPVLSTVKFSLAHFRHTRGLEEVDSQINQLNTQLSEVIQRVRTVSRDLTPTTLQQYGLLISIEELLDRINASGALKATLNSSGKEQDLPPKTELALFRIVQELCNNALKHAQATELDVSLSYQALHVQLVVEDNGKGMKSGTMNHSIGLKNIEARVSLIDGIWNIHSEKNQGVRSEITIPLPGNGSIAKA